MKGEAAAALVEPTDALARLLFSSVDFGVKVKLALVELDPNKVLAPAPGPKENVAAVAAEEGAVDGLAPKENIPVDGTALEIADDIGAAIGLSNKNAGAVATMSPPCALVVEIFRSGLAVAELAEESNEKRDLAADGIWFEVVTFAAEAPPNLKPLVGLED